MPIRIHAADGLSVLLDGESPTVNVGKASRKLRELLAVLVCGQLGARQEDLTAWLWPETDGDRFAASLKIAIHRLRRRLGVNAVVI